MRHGNGFFTRFFFTIGLAAAIGGCDPGDDNPAFDAQADEGNARAASLGLPEVPQGHSYKWVAELEFPPGLLEDLADDAKLQDFVDQPFLHECWEVVEGKGNVELPCEKVWMYLVITQGKDRDREVAQVIEVTPESDKIFPAT